MNRGEQPIPADMRDQKISKEKPLMREARELAMEIAKLRPDPRYDFARPRALVVGGYVRDALWGLDPKDADLEVYGVSPERLVRLLEKRYGLVNEVGKAFGVLKVAVGEGLELDISIARRDSKVGAGHKGIQATADPTLDHKEAARRRDYTINTLAYDPIDGTIIDSYNGMEDIRARVLRVTDREQFQEDPLRVLRGVQFVGRFGLTVEPGTRDLLKEMVTSGMLAELPAERVTGELEKLLTKSPRPSVGFEFAREIGVVERLFPELHATIDVPQEKEWHPEGDVWIHTLMVLDAAAKIAHDPARGFTKEEQRQIILGALGHDFGKPLTTKVIDGRIRSLGHEEAGEEPVRAMCSRLSFGSKDVEAAVAAAIMHLSPGMLYRSLAKGDFSEKSYVNAVRKVVKRLGGTSWRVLLAVSEADSRGRTLPGADTAPYEPGIAFARAVVEHKLDADPRKKLIQGRDLIDHFGLSPKGKQATVFGEIQRAVEAARDAGEIATYDEALAFVREYLKNQTSA